jgi:hypothetical protein
MAQQVAFSRESNVPATLPGSGSVRSTAIRLFLTCWIVFTLHFASNTVREIFLALAIGDHLSFRVDEYQGMHPDLFEKPGYGWHIGANPGASMVAAIPYAAVRPAIDALVAKVNRQRAASGRTEPPVYNSPWPMAREFFAEAWRRGFDIKFGLAAFVMQSLCMAPSSALGAVLMFLLLHRLFGSERTALWLALLYAFGTPVFFRTGYLNHNMMLGHIAFLGLLALWNPGGLVSWSQQRRVFVAGLAGGAAVLFDYSGVVFLAGLFLYALFRAWPAGAYRAALTAAIRFACGAAGPILLLWFYQWRSFGHPFYPGQHWMPPVEWIELGYQGFTLPQLELFLALGFDYRFGLFTSCPIFLLAFAAPWLWRKGAARIPFPEMAVLALLPLGLWLFCSGIQYARLQFNTGIRYLAPAFPFLFVLTAAVLVRLPRLVFYFVSVAAVTEAWCLAMYRDVERGYGLAEPVLRVFTGGFQLPALTVLSRMGGEFGDYFAGGVSPLPLFALAGAIIFGIWKWTPSSPPIELPLEEK